MSNWQPIETCPEGVEVDTKIDDGHGVSNEQPLIKRTRAPGCAPLFFFPDNSMYVYYSPTHWKAKA